MTTRGPLALVAVSLTAALVACASPTTAAPHASDSPNQEALDHYALAVQDLGRRQYSSTYAGVEVDPEGDQIIVHRLPDAAFDQAVGQLVPAGRLVTRDAEHTEVQLQTWTARVTADRAYWQAHGIAINSVEATPGGKCVKVGVSDPGRVQADITAYYVGVPVCVEAAGPDVPLAPPR